MNDSLSRIFVVDNHPLMRGCLSHIITDEGDMEFCGEADGMSQALKNIKLIKPELVIIDLSLADGYGIDLIEHLKALDPKIRILVATMNDESIYAERVLLAGALGFVSKDVSQKTLVAAIRKVLNGEIYLSEQMLDRKLNSLVDGNGRSADLSLIDNLSNRELTVFDLLGQGLSNSLIARKLSLSVKTIEAHQANIKKKLGLHSGREMMRKAALWFIHDDRYRVLFENMSQGVFYQQADGSLVDCNPALLEMLGLTREEFLGKNWKDPSWKVINEDGSELSGEQHPSMQALRTGKSVHNVIAGVFNPRRQQFVWLSINAIPLFRAGGNRPYQVFVTLHDITEGKEMEKKLQYLSTHDPLTGLYNRMNLEVQLAEETHRATRYDHALSIFMLDIDRFKRINDAYGHLEGDVVLQCLAKTLEQTIREEDFASRYGGEEFVITLPETPLNKARELAERLFDEISGLRVPLSNGNEINITVSIGIATFPDHAESWVALLEAADKAMYKAKQAGRNQIKTA